MFDVHPATDYANTVLREVMLDCFSDYPVPMQLDQQAFDAMMMQRGLDLASSRIATIERRPVAIWLSAIRGANAYLIASGTRPGYRSRGIARALANDFLEHVRAASVESFQAEVIRSNDTAASLYHSLGMTQRREFDCYRLPAASSHAGSDHRFLQVSWDQIVSRVDALRDWQPSWQNSDQSLSAIADQLLCLALFEGTQLLAFAATNVNNGTVHQIAVLKQARNSGIATSLLRTTQHQLPSMELRFLNIWHSDTAFRALMNYMGANETVGQYELYMPVSRKEQSTCDA